MDSISKNSIEVTPTKDSQSRRSKISDTSKFSENFNPNLTSNSPGLKKTLSSPSIKSAKSQKSASRNPNPINITPRNRIRERKFVVAKKNLKKPASTVVCKCKDKIGGDGNSQKCLCVAYEKLRASQEEFFQNRTGGEDSDNQSKSSARAETMVEESEQRDHVNQNPRNADGFEGKVKEENFCARDDNHYSEEIELLNGLGSATIKRRRDELLEEARKSLPEQGRVMHLVKAFEKILSIPSANDSNGNDKEEAGEEYNKRGMKWALPGLQSKVEESQVSSSSFCPSEFFFNSEKFGLDLRVSSSLDSSQESISTRTSGGGRRSRRNSSDSSGTIGGRKWKKQQQLRVTSLKPFKLRTEQRGRSKEEEFIRKLQEMLIEEEKQRIPIAQGLPWTTDEPECLLKPPVREATKPVDLKLHSDIRAEERAEFDNQVAEKMSLIEQYRMERERQMKLAEEEEIRRLRKELVPRAQPMPYFDRPFIPKRSIKHPTIPREPKFHIPHHKKIRCMSWSDLYSHHHQ